MDSVAAVAFKQWLGKNGWAKNDVFLDVDDIGAGEIWKEALRKGKFRCEAIILLASPEALDSKECLAELRTAGAVVAHLDLEAAVLEVGGDGH